MIDAGSNSALKIAAKKLEIATWLPLTAYPMVLSPTPYDVPFSHNT